MPATPSELGGLFLFALASLGGSRLGLSGLGTLRILLNGKSNASNILLNSGIFDESFMTIY